MIFRRAQCPLRRFFRIFWRIPFSFFHVLKIDAFQQHGELGPRECEARFVGRGKGQAEDSAFKAFVPDRATLVVLLI